MSFCLCDNCSGFYDYWRLTILTIVTIIDLGLWPLQWNPDCTNLQGKRKLVRKIGEFEKSGVKNCWLRRGNDFWFELSGGSRNWGFELSGFHCNIKQEKHCLRNNGKLDSIFKPRLRQSVGGTMDSCMVSALDFGPSGLGSSPGGRFSKAPFLGPVKQLQNLEPCEYRAVSFTYSKDEGRFPSNKKFRTYTLLRF